MNIVVCVKYVPDAQSDRSFNEADNTTDREGVEGLLSELDEYAVEEALKLAESGEGEVTVAHRRPRAGRRRGQEGPADGRRTRACTSATRPSTAPTPPATSLILAEAIKKASGGQQPRPRPHGHVLDGRRHGRRARDGRRAPGPAAGHLRLRADHRRPVGARSAGTATPRPRRSSRRCRRWSRSPTRSTSRATPRSRGSWPPRRSRSRRGASRTSGVDAGQVGLDAAWTKVTSFAKRPPREQGQLVTDEGDGGTKLAEFLSAQKFL